MNSTSQEPFPFAVTEKQSVLEPEGLKSEIESLVLRRVDKFVIHEACISRFQANKMIKKCLKPYVAVQAIQSTETYLWRVYSGAREKGATTPFSHG